MVYHTCFFLISSKTLEQIPYIIHVVNKLHVDKFYKVKLFMTFETNQFTARSFKQYVEFHQRSLDTVWSLFFSDF